MEWNGMVWNGLDWNGLGWNGLEWNGMTWHGTKASSFRFWWTSRTKASLSHQQLSDFEGQLARKLRFHILHFHFLKEVSHGSFVFISCAFTFEGGLARNAFLRDSGCTQCCVLQDRTCPGRWMRKLVRRAVAEHSRLNRGHFRISPAMELTVQALFSQFDLTKFEGGLAGKLCFHIFHCHFLREVSNENFVFASSIFSVWGKSCTKASFSHLQLSLFEGGLARKLYFHILNFHFFQGGLARKLRFHILHFHFLKEVSHESLVFTSCTFTFWRISPAKCVFER